MALAGIVCLGVPGCGVVLRTTASVLPQEAGLASAFNSRVLLTHGTCAAVPSGPASRGSESKAQRCATKTEEDHVAVFSLRLQFAAVSEADSSARPGEQPESSVHVSARELQASSPGRPICSVQKPWVQALEFELARYCLRLTGPG